MTAWQLVGGARTRLAWQVGFDPSGAVVQASGFSAGLEEVPGYPVVGAATRGRALAEPAVVGLAGATSDRGRRSESPTPSASPSRRPPAPDRPVMTVPVSEVTVSERRPSAWPSTGSPTAAC